MAGRVTGIDVARALAALSVFVCHINGYWLTGDHSLPWPLPGLLSNGAHGVDLFIVISGFCLAAPLTSGRRLQVQQFWVRRALRILPAYYVGLALATLLATGAATWHWTVGRRADALDVVLHAGLLQTLVPGHTGTINGSLWSVALEAQLYAVFPLTVLAWRRWGIGRLVAACAILSVAWMASRSLGVPLIGDNVLLPARMVQFTAGIGVAEAVGRGWRPRTRTCSLVLAGGTFAGVAVTTAGWETVACVVWAVPSVALLALLIGRPETGWLRWMAALGGVSYSFYLLHQPVILVLGQGITGSVLSPYVLLAGGCTIGFLSVLLPTLVMYRWVERPSRDWARRVLRSPVVHEVAPSDQKLG